MKTEKNRNKVDNLPQANTLNDLCRYFSGIPSNDRKKPQKNGYVIPMMVFVLIVAAMTSFITAQPVPVSEEQTSVMEETEFQEESIPEAQMYYSTAELNVRSGPGTDYEIIDTISFGEEIEVVTIEEGWAEIKTLDKNAYVSADYLSQSQPETASEDEGPMVWVSYSGNKYHSNPSCSGMKGATQVTLRSAQMTGKTPCSKCY